MILKKMLEYLGIYEDDESEIISLQIDSRKVKDGDVFLAYKGNLYDGNDYIQEAFENGASAVISDRYEGTRIYYCADLRNLKDSLANYFFEKFILIPFLLYK